MLGVEQQGPRIRPREGSLDHTPTHTIYALSYQPANLTTFNIHIIPQNHSPKYTC